MSGIGDRDIERLESLAKLRASGALTDAEFQAAKAKVLNPPPPSWARSTAPPRGAPGATSTSVTQTAAAIGLGSGAFGARPQRRTPGWLEAFREYRGLGAIVIAVLVWAAFMVATAGTAIVPGIQKWAAPIRCTGSYGRMVVNSQSGSYMPGESYTSYSEACVNAQGHFKPVNGFADRGVVWGESFLALLLLSALLTGSVSLWRRWSG